MWDNALIYRFSLYSYGIHDGSQCQIRKRRLCRPDRAKRLIDARELIVSSLPSPPACGEQIKRCGCVRWTVAVKQCLLGHKRTITSYGSSVFTFGDFVSTTWKAAKRHTLRCTCSEQGSNAGAYACPAAPSEDCNRRYLSCAVVTRSNRICCIQLLTNFELPLAIAVSSCW